MRGSQGKLQGRRLEGSIPKDTKVQGGQGQRAKGNFKWGMEVRGEMGTTGPTHPKTDHGMQVQMQIHTLTLLRTEHRSEQRLTPNSSPIKPRTDGVQQSRGSMNERSVECEDLEMRGRDQSRVTAINSDNSFIRTGERET